MEAKIREVQNSDKMKLQSEIKSLVQKKEEEFKQEMERKLHQKDLDDK